MKASYYLLLYRIAIASWIGMHIIHIITIITSILATQVSLSFYLYHFKRIELMLFSYWLELS